MERASDSVGEASQNEKQSLQKLRDLINDIDFCMLITLDNDACCSEKVLALNRAT